LDTAGLRLSAKLFVRARIQWSAVYEDVRI
jgi:hypothetical protein